MSNPDPKPKGARQVRHLQYVLIKMSHIDIYFLCLKHSERYRYAVLRMNIRP